MAAKTVEEKILENALAPKRARGDSGEAEQHPIPDQIAAAKLVTQTAQTRTGLGIKYVQLVPGNSD